MTATNHALTGAVIALAVRQPLAAIPLAFLSHFILDSIPHFGIYEGNVLKRNATRLFRLVLTIDMSITLSLLIILPSIGSRELSWALIMSCMVSAALPDAGWIPRFIREIKTKQWRPGNWFSRFHQKIQWFEKPIGLTVEAIWFLIFITLFLKSSLA